MSATCGDGHVWAGHEACDDGNTLNTDLCLTTCVAATCGDGFLRTAGTTPEACDDYNNLACGSCNEACDGPGTGTCDVGVGCGVGTDCTSGTCTDHVCE